MLKRFLQIFILLLTLFGSLRLYYNKQIGDVIDNYNGVEIYFNSIPFTSKGESLNEDGYKFGEKYQALEFVKRYYFERYNYKFPEKFDSIEKLYNSTLKDGEKSLELGLVQYSNLSTYPFKEEDIILFKPTIYNPQGHIAIISKVEENSIEIIQQNCWKTTRKNIDTEKINNLWHIKDNKILGRLQK